MTVASIYVPNGGKDFPAKMKFLETLDPDNDGLFTWWPPWRNMRQATSGGG